jgi:hypothetical protein
MITKAIKNHSLQVVEEIVPKFLGGIAKFLKKLTAK